VLPGCGRTLCAACVAGCVRVGQLMRPTCRQPFLADEVRTNFFLRDPIAGVAAAAAEPLAIDPARLTLLAAGGPNGDGVLGSGSFGRVGPPSPVAWRRRDSASQPGETSAARSRRAACRDAGGAPVFADFGASAVLSRAAPAWCAAFTL
jgi:hypothetical protein